MKQFKTFEEFRSHYYSTSVERNHATALYHDVIKPYQDRVQQLETEILRSRGCLFPNCCCTGRDAVKCATPIRENERCNPMNSSNPTAYAQGYEAGWKSRDAEVAEVKRLLKEFVGHVENLVKHLPQDYERC